MAVSYTHLDVYKRQTDISMPAGLLQKAFRQAVERSFNLVSVDGDTSTNDMALILANGAADITIDREDPRCV